MPLLGGILLGGYTRQLEAPAYLGPAVFLTGPLLGLLAAWIPLGFWNLAFVGSIFATAYWVAAWARALAEPCSRSASRCVFLWARSSWRPGCSCPTTR